MNPDFSDVSIYFQSGKKVFPNNWKSLDCPTFQMFYHPAKSENYEIGKNTRFLKAQGIVGIHLVHPSRGIVTKLRNCLESGRSYDIYIELKIYRLNVNSEFKGSHFSGGKLLDSVDLDYNFPISLITCFSSNESQTNKDKRHFTIFDLPEKNKHDSTQWFKLHEIYTADGDEEYFTIGTDSTDEYIEILKKVRNDTIDYKHKFACYLISKVSITPRNSNVKTSVQIIDQFKSDSIQLTLTSQKFILRRINFGFSSFDLADSSKEEIDRIALFMKENRKFSLRFTGHTDSTGTYQYNQLLSEKRANAVYQYLISLGIDKSRLKFEGKGEEQPLDDISLMKNLGVSRRVEFEFRIQ